ncbi:OsmC family protein [Mariprofundus erugo]|uniref:OsmC family protein n=2 Tax=Mariprofundus erugo TaxID=2528639 RepID=A0A5R9GLW3_9PROT|nr:OsmC family protein [Mariprofundus erugo]TLS66125.1 OsmC family protein [Mariprofundus erugo]TLS75617.1 OsmC family protein [Mariprofundus erugo]
MRMRIGYDGGCRFTAACRSHELIIDQPTDNGGSDEGMTPPELMAASLAGCVAFYVARYCTQAGIDTTGLEVGCDWTVAEDAPRRIGVFTVEVDLPSVPENRRKAVERVANQCLVHATLMHPPVIDVVLK